MALLQQVEAAAQNTTTEQIRSPLDQVLHGDAAILGIFFGLVALAVLGLLIALLKVIQIARLRGELHRFERESFNAVESGELFEVARRDQRSPGARVVLAIAKRGGSHGVLEAVAKRAIVAEQQRATSLLAVLASVAAASPFIGLLGTVYGIMKAFVDISRNNSASLKVVAPAIGEALVTTLVGLVAAIPALVAYNMINRWVDGLLSELEAASGAWVTIIADSDRVGPRGGSAGGDRTLANPTSGAGFGAAGSQGPPRPSFPTY